MIRTCRACGHVVAGEPPADRAICLPCETIRRDVLTALKDVFLEEAVNSLILLDTEAA